MKKEKTMLEQIIEYCSKNGITSYELAKHLPLSQVALHGILSGTTTQPRIKNVQIIYDYLFGSNNVVEEKAVNYNLGFDKKIESLREDIENVKLEILSWEEKIKLKPEHKQEYETYIQGFEKQIFLLTKQINLILEAKNDYLEDNYK